jgi:hypothetical protein
MLKTLPIAVASVLAFAAPTNASPGEAEAHVVLTAWSEMLTAGDHAAVANLHSRLSRLQGADVADEVGRENIGRYYSRTKTRSVEFGPHGCRVFDDGNGLCSGVYTLRQTLPSGEDMVRPAQFSMALVVEDGVWMIYDHLTFWLPRTVADCGVSIPLEKRALLTASVSQAPADLCGSVAKALSPAAVTPVASDVPPVK